MAAVSGIVGAAAGIMEAASCIIPQKPATPLAGFLFIVFRVGPEDPLRRE